MAALRHLTTLGSTAVALRPAYAGPHERPLGAGGPPPAWGDKPLGFFTPERRYAVRVGPLTAAQQFKIMVTTLHAAGIEVLLDVLYTPTAEGNHLGPTLSLRGIDNAAYYQLAPDNLRYYRAAPGAGNTLNLRHPHVLQLLMDSLRYWVTEMHVDGFRFAGASPLAREHAAVDRVGALGTILHQDPVLSQVKLMAEPWDGGPSDAEGDDGPGRWRARHGQDWEPMQRGGHGDQGPRAA